MAEESTKKPTRRTERIGKYEILDHIATGGMGVIYKARDVDLERLVALKLLPAAMAKQKNILIRFQREARAAALLRHENIVTIFDVGEDNGLHYIAFEFIDGTDLQEYISRKCRLDPEDARQIIIQAARALAHAHEHGVVHRDIKPSNFLLMHKDKRLIVKLSDFGLAMRHENEADFRITRAKTTVGTVDYMSPEQARDSRSVDIRSDIYSLGCTFYHMLAGEAPFARGTLPERIVQHMQAPPDVRKLNKSVPEYLVAVIQRMLAKDPIDRYQTPAELLHDLENPEEITRSDRRGAGPEKLERGAARRKPIDLTQVIENTETPEEGDEQRQVKAGKLKNGAGAPASETDADAENEASDDSVGSGIESDASEESSEIATATPEEPARKRSTGSPLWMYAIGGSVGVLLLVLILALVFGGRPPPKKDVEPNKKAETPPVAVAVVPVYKEEKPKPPPIDTSPDKMTVGPLDLPVLSAPPSPADRAALRKQYYGPFTAFPEAPQDAMVLRVSRLAAIGANVYRTLADAFAAAKPNQFTVIEIDDNGPVYVPFLAPVARRNVLVRAGAAFRPLIVWDVPKRTGLDTPVTSFCSFSQGKLILDGLDFVMRWSDDAPVGVFDMPDSDFHARACTFSIAGKSAQGIALVRRHAPKAAPVERVATRTWLKRCCLRGADATLLDLRDSPAEVLVEDSLVVGHERPLFHLVGRDEDAFSLFCIRSTLVSGQVLLSWQSQSAKGGGAPIYCRALDSILSRDDTIAATGDMARLSGVAELSKMSWRSANTVYAGWKRLLASDQLNIAGTDLEAWHRQWIYSTGDRALVDTWPLTPPTGLHDQPAETFRPAHAPVAFAALTRAGSIGCVIGRLPPTPPSWLERTFEPRVVPIIAGVQPDPPRIENANDGLYHGERLDLDKIDLGAHLASVLRTSTPAPRVVLHLTGQGVRQTSPIRVKGVRHLVLYFEPAKSPGAALTLEASQQNVLERAPIIDMSEGHLEMIGARIQLGPSTVVPTIVHQQTGDLTLTRCLLQGPLTTSAGGFNALITISNANGSPKTLLLRESVLASSKLLILAQGDVAVKARNNVFFGLGDGVHFDADGAGAALLHLFDHNTWAIGQSLFTVRTGSDLQAAAPMRLYAASNAFWFPFAQGADKTALLRGAEPMAAQGLLTWQGQYNVYDPRMRAFFARSAQEASVDAQTLRDWQFAWGQIGEQNALLVTPAPVGKTILMENVTPATLPKHLDRLVLPRQLRGDPNQSPPGADLTILRR